MNTVIQRTLTGSIFVSVIIISLRTHPLAFALVTSLLNFASLFELKKMGEPMLGKVYKEWIPLNSISFLLFAFAIAFDLPLAIALSPFILLYLLLLIMPIYKLTDNTPGNIFLPVFSSFYISIPLVLLNLIHQKSADITIPLCLALFAVIWTNDTFAYLSGMAFGRHRLLERISPKKSWEGFIGGSIMGVVAAIIFHYFFPEYSTIKWVIFAVLISISGAMGDLFESLLKRWAGIKDSGNTLPGHGGILDRIDSVLFVSPVIYLYILFF